MFIQFEANSHQISFGTEWFFLLQEKMVAGHSASIGLEHINFSVSFMP